MKLRVFQRPKLRTCLLLLPPAFLGLVAIHFLVLPTVHRRFGLCPLTLSRFAESKAIPILYGLPMPSVIEEARQGRIILGGCLIGTTVAVCPHCHVGVKSRDWDDGLNAP